jgi:membrane fusion protein (multidrug efflux system)
LLVAGPLLSGCGKNYAAAPQAPPPEVSVIEAAQETVPITTELPGRINATREAQVRARATGILLKRLFEEGSHVEEGQVLFLIDPAPMEAALNSAKAAYAKTEAALKEARSTVERYKPLTEINAISRQTYDEAEATLAQLEAELLANQAAVETAELNLGYTRVTAPISGRIGKALVTEGALVSATEATQLAVIRQLDPVYLDITQSSAETLQLKRAARTGAMVTGEPEQASITLVLEDGSQYGHPAQLLFSDVSVDPGTGMITLRAVAPNPEHLLMPGMFARGVLVQGYITNAVTIPLRTVTRGPAGRAFVLVVNEQDIVEQRPIEIRREIGSKVIVANGLRAGERVLVEGSQKAPPGTPVRTTPYQPVNLAGTNSRADAKAPAHSN